MRRQRALHRLGATRLNPVVQLDEHHVRACEPIVALFIGEELFLGTFDIELKNIDTASGVPVEQIIQANGRKSRLVLVGLANSKCP